MMKKIIPMIMAIFFAMTTMGQTVELEGPPAPIQPGDIVGLTVVFDGFASNIGAVTLFIDYDVDLLTYQGWSNPGFVGGSPEINPNNANGQFALSYFTGTASNGNFITLNFLYLGGFDANFEFTGESEIADVGLNIVITYPDNPESFIGTTLLFDDSNPDGTATLGSVTGIAGASVSVPVSITDDGGFDGVASSMTLYVAYDTEKLVYTGVTGNSLGFIPSNEVLGVVKLTKSTLTPLNFPLADPVINLTFDYLGGGTAAVVWKSGSVVTDSEASILITKFENGEVTLDPNFTGRLTIAKVSSPDNPVDPVAVPIVAEGFESEDVGEISLSINFDSQKLTYAGFVPNQFTGWNVTSINQTEGTLEIVKTSATPLTIVNGDLITLSFEYGSGLAVIGFDPGTFVKDTEAVPIPTQLIDGHVAAFTNLSIKLFLEGLYDSGGMMRKAKDHDGTNPIDKFTGTVADQITVRLHDKDDYNTVIWTAIEIDLNTDGTASLVVPSQYDGEYYLTILHRNHLETVSGNTIDFSPATVSYDFTDFASKAYGDNQNELETNIFGIFAGDVMQTGEVDVTDRAEVINNLGNQGYISPDIDGSGEVDVSDRADVIKALGREAKTP